MKIKPPALTNFKRVNQVSVSIKRIANKQTGIKELGSLLVIKDHIQAIIKKDSWRNLQQKPGCNKKPQRTLIKINKDWKILWITGYKLSSRTQRHVHLNCRKESRHQNRLIGCEPATTFYTVNMNPKSTNTSEARMLYFWDIFSTSASENSYKKILMKHCMLALQRFNTKIT